MLILTIRTDKPEAELGLYEDANQLAYITWQAHRQLSDTIHIKIKELLESQNKSWADIEGIVCFQGPGSFTGLRIGISVANALASSADIPVVASKEDAWINEGIEYLSNTQNQKIIVPNYGSEPRTTKQVK